MNWYENDVKALETKCQQLTYTPKSLFYGSSSIRLWSNLYDDFPEYQPVNLGFGGSTLAACDWFYDRIVSPFNPEFIVLYAGDNDLGDGRNPEEVFLFFQQFTVLTQKRFGNIPCFFLSLKPSIARWNLVEKFKYANQIIGAEIEKSLENWHFINIFDSMIDESGKPKKEYYDSDGLHLSPKGYDVWKNIIRNSISSIIK